VNEKESFATKKVKLNIESENEFIQQFQRYSLIREKFGSYYSVYYFDAWFKYYSNKIGTKSILFFLKMELFDKTLRDIIDAIDENKKIRKDQILTFICHFIANQLFIEILESIDCMHR
jgi:serine/threonine protein kinase